MKKIPDTLKTELYQLIFWSIVFGIVLVGIVFIDEIVKPLIGIFL
jgi:hypothetical protein